MSTETAHRASSNKQAPATAGRGSAAADPAADAEVNHRYKIICTKLKVGMFVAELDRPWLDTPFLIQGFSVASIEEQASLARHCRFVYVDLEKSDPSVVNDILAAQERKLPINESNKQFKSLKTNKNAGTKTPEHVSKSPTEGRERFNRYMKLIEPESNFEHRKSGWFGSLLAWIDRLFEKREDPKAIAARAKVREHEIRKLVPRTVKLVQHEDRVPVQEELPRANQAFKKTEKTLRDLVSSVKSGSLPNIDKAEEVVGDIVESMINNPDAMMWVSRMRDKNVTTLGHAVKVSLYMVAIGRHMGFPKEELCNLGMIGLLADVGKTKLPKAVLEKPGMLTPQEYTVVKEHVRLGLDALQQQKPLDDVVFEGISQHHERLDGSGYPKGLKGPEIGIYGRLAAIADTFSALITPRAYANPVSPHEALLSLFEWAGSSFHEPLVEQFVQAVGVFPVGSMVELSTHEVAIVLAHNKVRRLEPRVLVLTWPDKTPLATPIERNLFDKPKGADGKPVRIVRSVSANEYDLDIGDYYGVEMANSNRLI
ncbi:MAG: HD-GYP domain-containing protein [Burkholderiaceae bacterium]